MVQFGADPSDSDTLGKSLEQLDELFLLVVVGEFNAGKSAFINALLGQRLLKEGVTPTTTQINTFAMGQPRIARRWMKITMSSPCQLTC